jgi:hypothetical protein
LASEAQGPGYRGGRTWMLRELEAQEGAPKKNSEKNPLSANATRPEIPLNSYRNLVTGDFITYRGVW